MGDLQGALFVSKPYLEIHIHILICKLNPIGQYSVESATRPLNTRLLLNSAAAAKPTAEARRRQRCMWSNTVTTGTGDGGRSLQKKD